MEAKSERTGKFLFLFLIVELIGSGLSFLCSAIHKWQEAFYEDQIFWIDTAVSVFRIPISIMTIIFFLVWIYRVHSEFLQVSPDYPITPGGALRRIMIPFYNIVGLWTVYSSMARFLVRQDDSLIRNGQRLMGLIPFYYFGQVISNGLNRAMITREDPSINLELWATIFDLFVTLMYISMFVAIRSGLMAAKECQQNRQEAAEG